MPRKRLVSPDFFQHDGLFELEVAARQPVRLAYIGLWTQADRRGVFEWRPLRLKLALFPYDGAVDMNLILDYLEDRGFIRMFMGPQQRKYGWIPSFQRWQTFHKDEKQNREWPDPPAEVVADTWEPPRSRVADTVPTPGQPGANLPVTVTVTGTGTGTGTVAVAVAAPPGPPLDPDDDSDLAMMEDMRRRFGNASSAPLTAPAQGGALYELPGDAPPALQAWAGLDVQHRVLLGHLQVIAQGPMIATQYHALAAVMLQEGLPADVVRTCLTDYLGKVESGQVTSPSPKVFRAFIAGAWNEHRKAVQAGTQRGGVLDRMKAILNSNDEEGTR